MASPLPLAIPGPSPSRFLGWRGNLLAFARDSLGYTLDIHQRFGAVAAFVRGGGSGPLNSTVQGCPGTIFALGPSYNQQILSDPQRFQASLILGTEGTPHERLGNNLLAMNGEKHRQQRRFIMPAFQKSRLDAYHADMVAITQRVLDSWRPGDRRDIFAEMRQLTLQIASKALFGLELGGQAHGLGHMIDRWMKLGGHPLVILFPWNLPFTPRARFMKASRELEAAIVAMIAAKRTSGRDEGDVLSALVHVRDEQGGGMSEDDLVGQANLLFLAGHETTANALTWTIYLLAQHPQAMADVCDELAGCLRGSAPQPRQLAELLLLERVIKESMRILPPVPLGSRTVMGPTQIGQFEMPRFTEVVFSQYVTHHLPELYPDPERFKPERWELAEPSAYEYLPFLAGSRMCVGATFAMQEIKIVLAMLLQRYRLEIMPQTRIDRFVNMTLSPKQGLPMLVRQQDGAFSQSSAEVQGNIREMVRHG